MTITETEKFIRSKKIQLYPSGMWVDPFELSVDDIAIADIARSNSMEVRFGGHLSQFWSVAQHELVVSAILPDECKLEGLLHDGGEAYFKDLQRPVKHRPSMMSFRGGERMAQEVISRKYGLVYPFPKLVHVADDLVCTLEAKHFKAAEHEVTSDALDVGLANDRINQLRMLQWYAIERIFLGEFVELMRGRSNVA